MMFNKYTFIWYWRTLKHEMKYVFYIAAIIYLIDCLIRPVV